MMRIASYNVENLFARAKALNQDTWAEGRPILAAHAELNTLLQNETYEEPDKKRILELLVTLGLAKGDESEFVRLRKIRGRLLKRPKTGPVQVVATGRPSWIGWVELKTEQVDELAMKHTAKVIRDVNADVLGVVEADSRPVLKLFSGTLLKELGATPYEQVMLVDGNDDRGIDVGILARKAYPLEAIRTHVFDVDAEGVVFRGTAVSTTSARRAAPGSSSWSTISSPRATARRTIRRERRSVPAKQPVSPRSIRAFETPGLS